jgi:hypothetical protein
VNREHLPLSVSAEGPQRRPLDQRRCPRPTDGVATAIMTARGRRRRGGPRPPTRYRGRDLLSPLAGVGGWGCGLGAAANASAPRPSALWQSGTGAGRGVQRREESERDDATGAGSRRRRRRVAAARFLAVPSPPSRVRHERGCRSAGGPPDHGAGRPPSQVRAVP